MSLKDCLQAYQIQLELGSVRVGGETDSPLEELLLACESLNTSARIKDLSDHLNPNLIDPAKLIAFLRYFPHLPANSLAQFSEQTILLEDEALSLSRIDPISPESFEAGFELNITEWMYDTIMILKLRIVKDADMAKTLIQEAKQVLTQSSQEIESLEESRFRIQGDDPQTLRSILDDLSHARMRRSALATTWLRNAKALAQLHPDEDSYQEDMQKAQSAFDLFYEQPPMGGMGMP